MKSRIRVCLDAQNEVWRTNANPSVAVERREVNSLVSLHRVRARWATGACSSSGVCRTTSGWRVDVERKRTMWASQGGKERCANDGTAAQWRINRGRARNACRLPWRHISISFCSRHANCVRICGHSSNYRQFPAIASVPNDRKRCESNAKNGHERCNRNERKRTNANASKQKLMVK